jgi:hypothetical protein
MRPTHTFSTPRYHLEVENHLGVVFSLNLSISQGRVMNKLSAVLFVCLLAGCASTGSQPPLDLAKFLGKNISEAKEELGKPTRVVNLQNGTWHYSWSRKSGFGGFNSDVMGVSLTKKKQKMCSNVLIVDEKKSVLSFASDC